MPWSDEVFGARLAELGLETAHGLQLDDELQRFLLRAPLSARLALTTRFGPAAGALIAKEELPLDDLAVHLRASPSHASMLALLGARDAALPISLFDDDELRARIVAAIRAEPWSARAALRALPEDMRDDCLVQMPAQRALLAAFPSVRVLHALAGEVEDAIATKTKAPWLHELGDQLIPVARIVVERAPARATRLFTALAELVADGAPSHVAAGLVVFAESPVARVRDAAMAAVARLAFRRWHAVKDALQRAEPTIVVAVLEAMPPHGERSALARRLLAKARDEHRSALAKLAAPKNDPRANRDAYARWWHHVADRTRLRDVTRDRFSCSGSLVVADLSATSATPAFAARAGTWHVLERWARGDEEPLEYVVCHELAAEQAKQLSLAATEPAWQLAFTSGAAGVVDDDHWRAGSLQRQRGGAFKDEDDAVIDTGGHAAVFSLMSSTYAVFVDDVRDATCVIVRLVDA